MVRSSNASKICFSTTLGEEPEIKLYLQEYRAVLTTRVGQELEIDLTLV